MNGQPTRVYDRTKLSEALIMYDNQLHKRDDMFANLHSGNLQLARYRCLLGRLRSSRCKDMANTKGIDSWALETDLGYTKLLDGPTHIGKPEPVRHSDEETLGRPHWILLVLGLGSERIA